MAKSSRNSKQILKVCVDTNVINMPGIGHSVLQMCESQGFYSVVSNQAIRNMVTWHLETRSHDNTCVKVEETDSVLVVVLIEQLVAMVDSHVKKSRGLHFDHLQDFGGESGDDITFAQFAHQLQATFPDKHLIIVLYGVDNYFSEQKLDAKRRHRKEVRGQEAQDTRKGRGMVTRSQVDEAILLAQLETCCSCVMVNTSESVADLIKSYSKAIMDKPKKQHRLSCVFSFLEEGTTGVKPEKTGAGLLQAWKQQLCQLPGLGHDVAEAITARYPSIEALRQAYDEYPGEKWRLTENIMIRRGAGALETGRRVGKQLSLRLHLTVTSDNPSCVL